jgi:hypothetical protein
MDETGVTLYFYVSYITDTSIFMSALYRNWEVEWLFPQEKTIFAAHTRAT